MARGLTVGGDVERALGNVSVPSYVLDTSGVVRWINPASERLLGDVRGRHFTSVVSPEDRPRAKQLFTSKVLGTASATDSTGVLVSTAGDRVPLEISSVPPMGGERVVGVFGLLSGPLEHQPSRSHPALTPRQTEVLRLLEQGRSTKQIAHDLSLSTETARNHIRHILRTLECTPDSKLSPPHGTPRTCLRGPPGQRLNAMTGELKLLISEAQRLSL